VTITPEHVIVPAPEGITGIEERHPGTRHFGPLFAYGHLPDKLKIVSLGYASLAASTIRLCKDGPELSAALRKLLEAKDCAVRAAL
jgi:hypothetical protein